MPPHTNTEAARQRSAQVVPCPLSTNKTKINRSRALVSASAILLHYQTITTTQYILPTMEMSKPHEQEEKATDFLTPPTPLKTESAANSVKDLERRLQMMSQAETKPAAPKPAPAAQPAAAAGGGKNALLARIMAAQNKNKAPAPATSTSAPPMSFDPMSSAPPPPPAFDATSLPAPQDSALSSAAPPPTFDDVFSMGPPTTQPPAPPAPSNLMWDPMAPAPDPTTNNNNTAEAPWTPHPPSAPSAPAFEDLLGFDQQQHPPPMPPPPSQEQEAHSPQQVGLDEETLQAILGMEGMSMAEKQAMIDEQERIMREIEEKNKPVSAADAFRQRSHAAAVQAIGGGAAGSSSTTSAAAQRTVDIGNGHEVALKGQEQTQKAIQDGTAVLAQCLSCQNWMQVTGNATLMFCPTCQTVSPVLKADDTEAAAQLKADMELAQRLQNEEYSAAEQRDQQRQQRSSSNSPNKKKSSTASSSSSWWDYLGFGSGATAATGVAAPAPSFAVKPPVRGDMGVSRPPGSSGRRLEPAQTGEEGGIGYSHSYEDDGPLLGGGGGAAVVAPRQTSLFACVGDSITSAATQLTNALNTDEEGNVHGVDSSGLLAMPQVGRESNYRNMDDGRL
uniref:Uncharacterized protein n=1 Tax=Amphora coffeiformis TaxID=265554 RepID=A0A7S3KZC6_9STRA